MSGIPSLQAHEMLQTSGLQEVFSAIAKAGGEARIVGGAVRNGLLGEPVQDIDIATDLLPEQVVAAAKRAHLKAVPTGIDHGTVTIVSHNRGFEVTTLRHDVETDGRRATVAYTDDWAADAARRDFTLNALYCDRHGKVHDPLGGYADLKSRNIRFVGDPVARITEDYLRILRFFRFFAQYGDGPADKDALAACSRLRDGLKQLSRERIGQEMRKLLMAKRAVCAVRLMNQTGVGMALFSTDVDADSLECVVAIDAAHELAPDYALRLAACLPLEANVLGGLLRLPKAEERAIAAMRDCMPPAPGLRDNERKVVLYRTGADTWRRVVRLDWARSDADANDAEWHGLLRLPDEWAIPTLPVTGADIMAAGVPAGPNVGETLRALEDWWMAGGFVATREELLGRVST